MNPTTIFDVDDDDDLFDPHAAHIDSLVDAFICDGFEDPALTSVVIHTAADTALEASPGTLDWRRFDPESYFEAVPYPYGSEQRAAVVNVLHNFFHWMIEAGHIGMTDGLCLVHTLGVFVRDELVPAWPFGAAWSATPVVAERVWN